MDIVGMLLQLGFWQEGAQKGFRVNAGELELWLKSESLGRAREELQQAQQWISSDAEGDIRRDDGNIISLRLTRQEELIDVWVVGQDSPSALAEVSRWRLRGYRVRALSPTDEVPLRGFVVRLDGPHRYFSGYLPRHPQSGAMVQSWH